MISKINDFFIMVEEWPYRGLVFNISMMLLGFMLAFTGLNIISASLYLIAAITSQDRD